MPLTAGCPSCGQKLTVPDHLAGKRVRCPKCASTFSVEAPEGADPEPRSSRRHDEDERYRDEDRPRPPRRRDDEGEGREDDRSRRRRRRRDDDDHDDGRPGRGGVLVTLGVSSIALGVLSVPIGLIPFGVCLSFVMVIAGLILGIVGSSMARADLKKLRRGRISRSAESATKGGYVTSVIGAIINAIVLVLGCVIFMIGFAAGVSEGYDAARQQQQQNNRPGGRARNAWEAPAPRLLQ